MSRSSRLGIVTAARKEAAFAGTLMLREGGNAVDAAIAAAFALAVTDPANCGIGGYGGFSVVSDRECDVVQIAFNTHVPATHDETAFGTSLRRGPFLYGGASIAPPAVVPGLACLHGASGRLAWAQLLAPAIALAEDGFYVGSDLSRAARWALQSTYWVQAGLRAFLCHDGEPLRPADRLVQHDLATTLRGVATLGPDAILSGEIATSIIDTARQHGGALLHADIRGITPRVLPPHCVTFANAEIFGCAPDESGFAIAAEVLASNPNDWPSSRQADYLELMTGHLATAWKQRDERFRMLATRQGTDIQHTTHLCASDAEGITISMTFTHGPLWFGSGLMVKDTGVILNCGANLFVEDTIDGRQFAQTNLSPVIIHRHDGSKIAFGTPGGRKIPAMVAALAIDVLARGDTVATALSNPRIATMPDGRAEAEAPVDTLLPYCRRISTEEFYGPASAIEVFRNGSADGYTDPRFEGAVEAA